MQFIRRDARRLGRVIVHGTLVLCALGALSHAQNDPAFQERNDPIATNPFPSPLPPPDDTNEPDVAKRNLFLWELNRQRVCFYCMWRVDGLTPEAQRDIPDGKKTQLMEKWHSLLADELLPTTADSIEWYGTWAIGRDGPELGLIVAQWRANGYLVRFKQVADVDWSCSVTVRSPRRQRLEFRATPPNIEEPEYSMWESVPRVQMDQLLGELMTLDREKVQRLRMHGRMTGGAGVRAFSGTFRWLSELNTTTGEDGDVAAVPEGARPERIFITDSDPQYVCIQFDLRPK